MPYDLQVWVEENNLKHSSQKLLVAAAAAVKRQIRLKRRKCLNVSPALKEAASAASMDPSGGVGLTWWLLSETTGKL